MQKTLKAIISPSILACDFSQLASECNKVIAQGADWIHFDVMDYQFVPNLTFGPPIITSLRSKVQGFFDVHCMIQEPYKWVEDFAKSGANMMTFHYEADLGGSIENLISKIKTHGMQVGLALKPKTEITDEIIQLIDNNQIDMVLIMTVEPGFGGQSFMISTMDKVRFLRNKYHNLNIQVDGGVKCDNIDIAAEAGANVIVSGTGIFNHKDPTFAIQVMRESVQKQIEKQ